MGLVLSAANVRGWTTDSGMEGPPVPAGSESESSTEKISTFPCSLFTKSPRRRMRVAFTCNVCGQGTTRAINPHVYTEVPAGSESESSTEKISTFPWSLFTKSPRRRMRVSFTCNVCGQRTTRAINPHAYTDGTVFVQCCGCNVFHKLVDNLLPERLSISNMLPSSLPVEALHNGKEECGRDFDICGVEGILRNMSAIEREVLGFMCKDIIDMGRFMWLKEHGLESQLVNMQYSSA